MTPSHPTTLKTHLKAKALAARLGVHPKTLFRWAESGLIRRYKVSARVVLFDEAEVAKMISDAQVGSTS